MNRLKKEMDQLKRENQRLKKLLRQSDPSAVDPFEDEDEAPDTHSKKGKKAHKKDRAESGLRCSKCKEPAEIKDLGPYQYRWCKDPKCNHRTKLK